MSELSGVAVMKSQIADIKRQIRQFCEVQDRHDQDLYRGDGDMPGVTTRVLGTEKRLDILEKTKTERSAREWALLLIAASTFVTVIVDRIWPHK